MNTPWYKEPWAWLVFFLPLSAVIAGITTLIIANTDPDTLVAGDYYKKGKAINLEIGKVKLAQKLGIRFDLKLHNNELVIKPSGIEKKFPFLNIDLFHPTLEEHDISLKLTPDASGNFRHTFDKSVTGKWRITISSFQNEWKIQNNISLPQSEFIQIIPKPNEAN